MPGHRWQTQLVTPTSLSARRDRNVRRPASRRVIATLAYTTEIEDSGSDVSHLLGLSRGQLRRRRAILDAACNIIIAGDDDALTMRVIARDAGVSPTTPYNLFGTKHEILRTIYEEDLTRYLDYFQKHASPDPLLRIFDLNELSIEYTRDRPEFFRALFRNLMNNASAESGLIAWSARKAFIQELIADAARDGCLIEDTPLTFVGDTIFRLQKAICREWTEGDIELDDARCHIGQSFHLVLTQFVTDGRANDMENVLQRYRSS
jgi:AcrR family transcriptional regulator